MATTASKADKPTRKRRQAAPKTGYAKIGVTIPSEIAEAARRRVESGDAQSMSALVTEALVEKLRQDDLQALLAEMDADFGPVSPEMREWARRVVDSIPES